VEWEYPCGREQPPGGWFNETGGRPGNGACCLCGYAGLYIERGQWTFVYRSGTLFQDGKAIRNLFIAGIIREGDKREISVGCGYFLTSRNNLWKIVCDRRSGCGSGTPYGE
jgi:hypothetical protein